MKIKLIFILSIFSNNLHAENIASCSNPAGKGYYPEIGIVDKKDSGWSDEKISGGITTLVKIGNDEFDIRFVDVRKEVISATQDGGTVMMLNRGKNIASFLVVYPGKTVEVYTFLKNDSGNFEYIHTLSRGGDDVLITKSSLMRGECTFINFDQI